MNPTSGTSDNDFLKQRAGYSSLDHNEQFKSHCKVKQNPQLLSVSIETSSSHPKPQRFTASPMTNLNERIQTKNVGQVHTMPSIRLMPLDILCDLSSKDTHSHKGNKCYWAGLRKCFDAYAVLNTEKEKQLYIAKLYNTFNLCGARFLIQHQTPMGSCHWRVLSSVSTLHKIRSDIESLNKITDKSNGERKKAINAYRKTKCQRDTKPSLVSTLLARTNAPTGQYFDCQSYTQPVFSHLVEDALPDSSLAGLGLSKTIDLEKDLCTEPVFLDLESNLKLNLKEHYRALEAGKMTS